jgi:GLPGLI family protein
MKWFFLAGLALLGEALSAQTAGIFEYEVTRKVDGERIRVITQGMGQGGGSFSSEGNSMVITLKQSLFFSPGIGKLGEPRPAMAPPTMGEIRFRRPFVESTFIDFNNRQFIRYLRGGEESDDKSIYFLEEPFESTGEWKDAGKKKKILGYECQRATRTHEGARFTVFYTRELGVDFSPVNGFLPPGGGFVMAIEGDDMGYTLQSVDLEAKLTPEDFQPPGAAEKVDKATFDAKRRAFVQSMPMPEGGMLRMQRN